MRCFLPIDRVCERNSCDALLRKQNGFFVDDSQGKKTINAGLPCGRLRRKANTKDERAVKIARIGWLLRGRYLRSFVTGSPIHSALLRFIILERQSCERLWGLWSHNKSSSEGRSLHASFAGRYICGSISTSCFPRP